VKCKQKIDRQLFYMLISKKKCKKKPAAH